MQADTIVALLREKHSKDVFVSECKDGPSCGTYLRLDAWAMDRSWAHPCMYGYEVKVSRADFLGDNKWPGYLPLCNRFSFVTPKGIIDPKELADGVGLMEVASTGSMLRTIRKAAYREVDPPVALYQYLLMARTKIVAPRFGFTEESDADFWRRWLENKKATWDIGHKVSRRLSALIREKIDEVEVENIRIKAENEVLKEVKGVLKELGIYPGRWSAAGETRRQVEQLRQLIPADVATALHRAHMQLGELLTKVKETGEAKNQEGIRL